MTSYYTAIILITIMGLLVLSVLVSENGRINKADKKILYITYLLIALAAIAEWCGVQLNGNTDFPVWIITIAKCLDYILTPASAAALVFQMHIKNKWNRMLKIIVSANVVLQIISVLTGWVFYIDGNNVYEHGPLYPVYLLICASVLVILILQYYLYGKSFRRQNRCSLYAILMLILLSIAVQLIPALGFRTTYIGMAMAAAMMFIHYSEFTASVIDDELSEKEKQIETDVLTGVLSRYAYTDALAELDQHKPLPDGLAVFVIDINGLKTVNDDMGHDVGDELIIGAAECINRVFADKGRCYRTGGDEFVVLAEDVDREYAESVVNRLKQESSGWRGELVHELALAAGFSLSSENQGADAATLVRQADYAMYSAKAEYYRTTGVDRRRTRR